MLVPEALLHGANRPAGVRTPVQRPPSRSGRCSYWSGWRVSSPGITTHYDQLALAGHHSQAALLGVFNVSVLHNLVHLLFGVAGIALARTVTAARAYLIGGGAIYLVLFV